MADDATFVAAWERGDEIFSRRFLASGAAAAPEQRINTIEGGEEKDPWIAVHGDGRFAVAWESSREQVVSIRGRLFDDTGLADGGEFEIDSEGLTGADGRPRTPRLDLGSKVHVAYAEEDGVDAGTFLRSFNFGLFRDGFETGDTSVWSRVVGGE